MGEARARKRREARDAEKSQAQHAPQVTKYVLVELPLPARMNEQLRRRHARVSTQFPVYEGFLGALLMAGVETFDADVQALEAHKRGESKPVEKTAPDPDRMVLLPDEVSGLPTYTPGGAR